MVKATYHLQFGGFKLNNVCALNILDNIFIALEDSQATVNYRKLIKRKKNHKSLLNKPSENTVMNSSFKLEW